MSITPNSNKSLSDIFDVELATTDKSLVDLQIAAKVESIDDLEKQRKYVKDNIVALLEKGTTLLDNMTSIANSTEAAKDFKVASEIIQTLVDANIKLLDCEVAHKPKIDSTQVGGDQITTNNTAVFVGTTSDLSKYLKESAIQVTLNK